MLCTDLETLRKTWMICRVEELRVKIIRSDRRANEPDVSVFLHGPCGFFDRTASTSSVSRESFIGL